MPELGNENVVLHRSLSSWARHCGTVADATSTINPHVRTVRICAARLVATKFDLSLLRIEKHQVNNAREWFADGFSRLMVSHFLGGTATQGPVPYQPHWGVPPRGGGGGDFGR